MKATWRLSLEVLEDRLTPSGTGSFQVVSGNIIDVRLLPGLLRHRGPGRRDLVTLRYLACRGRGIVDDGKDSPVEADARNRDSHMVKIQVQERNGTVNLNHVVSSLAISVDRSRYPLLRAYSPSR
jgi:hypothetical protein